VFLDPGSDRENVGVEDDVLGRKAEARGEDAVGARADLQAALDAIGLTCSSNAMITAAARGGAARGRAR